MEKLTVHETPCMVIRMELHATDEAVDQQTAQRVAGEVRAEMARQKRTARELAAVVGISEHTAGRRLNGETPFNIVELAAACRWLGISIAGVLRRAEVVEAAAS